MDELSPQGSEGDISPSRNREILPDDGTHHVSCQNKGAPPYLKPQKDSPTVSEAGKSQKEPRPLLSSGEVVSR